MKNILLIIFCYGLFTSCSSQEMDHVVTITTKFGDIKVILYDQTPEHKKNFIKLARSGRYDSTTFHRVIQNFMVQGGDVNAKPDVEEKIDYTIPAEFVDTLIHHRGALAAARQGDQVNPERASSGCQFYIVDGKVFSEDELTLDMQKLNLDLRKLSEVPEYDSVLMNLRNVYMEQGPEVYMDSLKALMPTLEKRFGNTYRKDYDPQRLDVYTSMGGAPHLDDTYTVFGRVVEGMEVVDQIAAVKTAPRADKPVDDIYITMEVEEISKGEWQKLYGGLPY